MAAILICDWSAVHADAAAGGARPELHGGAGDGVGAGARHLHGAQPGGALPPRLHTQRQTSLLRQRQPQGHGWVE